LRVFLFFSLWCYTSPPGHLFFPPPFFFILPYLIQDSPCPVPLSVLSLSSSGFNDRGTPRDIFTFVLFSIFLPFRLETGCSMGVWTPRLDSFSPFPFLRSFSFSTYSLRDRFTFSRKFFPPIAVQDVSFQRASALTLFLLHSLGPFPPLIDAGRVFFPGNCSAFLSQTWAV